MRSIMKCVLVKIYIVFFLIIIILACGCQPTPHKAAVVYGGGLEEKLKGSPAPFAAYDAPARWQETLDVEGDTEIQIDASISVPDVRAFPVYKVKQAKFDQARIRSMVDYFTKGRDVIKDGEPTKADLEKQLIIAKNRNDEEMVADLEKRIATAPETVETEVITDWDADKSPAGSFLADDGEHARIFVRPNSFGYIKGYIQTEYVLLLNDKDAVGDIAISKEDAIAAAQDMLHELGIDPMSAGSLEKAQRHASISDAFNPDKKPLSKGYLIKFARNIDGISGITDDGVSFNIMDDFAYKAPLYPEEIQAYVDETGKVQFFAWSNPLMIEDKLNGNVRLLPFEDIKQRIRDMFTFIFSYNGNPTKNGKPLKVTRIKMNMAIVDVKDRPGEAMYIPAWFIYYTETFDTGEQECKLVLNAIDGGRVLECPVDISPEIQKQMDENRKKAKSAVKLIQFLIDENAKKM